MKIIKCGGTTLQNYEDRKILYDEIKKEKQKICLIVSAFSNSPYSTNSLNELLKGSYSFEMHQELIVLGEVIASLRVCNELLNMYVNAGVIYKEEIGINVFTTNKMEHIESLDSKVIKEKLELFDVLVIPGFIGINQDHKIVSLNKNGSDLTAMLIAKMLDVKEVILYKDVFGLSSINPKICKNYKLYKSISYDLMAQIVNHGSELIQEQALKIAKDENIIIHIQHYLNHTYETTIKKFSNEKVIVMLYNENAVFIDGYNNKEQIEDLLNYNHLKFDYILPCNSYLKIVSSYENENDIISFLHSVYIKGEL